MSSQNLGNMKVDWSCFFAAGFILDIYGSYKRDNRYNEKEINSVVDFIMIFEPGYIFDISISNHEFIVIYHKNGKITYIDYYRETGRDELFRLDEMKYEDILRYIEKYVHFDIEYHTTFHS